MKVAHVHLCYSAQTRRLKQLCVSTQAALLRDDGLLSDEAFHNPQMEFSRKTGLQAARPICQYSTLFLFYLFFFKLKFTCGRAALAALQ